MGCGDTAQFQPERVDIHVSLSNALASNSLTVSKSRNIRELRANSETSLPNPGRDSNVNTAVQNPQLRDALKSWIQVAAPLVTTRPSFQSEDSSLRQLDIDLMHLDAPIQRLEETRAVLDIAVRTPEFLGHASHQPKTKARNSDRADFFTKKVMSLFVRQYLAVRRQPDLDLNAFAMIYPDLEAYLYRFDDVPIRTTIEPSTCALRFHRLSSHQTLSSDG